MAGLTERAIEVEELLGISLAEFVGNRRAARKSWRLIALDITSRTGIDITGETVRVWCQGREPLINPAPRKRSGAAA